MRNDLHDRRQLRRYERVHVLRRSMQESERSGWPLSNQWRLFCWNLRQRREYERKDLLRHDLYGFAALWNDAWNRDDAATRDHECVFDG